MAKMIRHDFGAIHDALNNMIIAEVKAALELLPGKRFDWDGQNPLCRIVVSLVSDYEPENLAIRSVFLRDDGTLSFVGAIPDSDNEWHANEEGADWLDITGFVCLIDKIAEQVEGDETYNLPNKSVMTAGYVTELSLKQAVEKLVTV